MSAATFFLVRHAAHGQLGNRLCGRMAGATLGPEGHAQAARLATRLAGERVAAVYSSPRERAVDTAREIARACGADLEAVAALDELDYGAWTGVSWEELDGDPGWQAWNRDRPGRRPPGGETLAEMQRRVVDWIEVASARHQGERVAAVFHAEPIRAALAWALDAPLRALDRIEIAPASISVLAAGAWGVRVHRVNEEVA